MAIAVATSFAQPPSELPDHTRVSRTEVEGRRVELNALKGATLFVGPGFRSSNRAPLIVHFHGAPWLVQYQVATKVPHAALITVQLGAGSSVYGRPFEDPELFGKILEEARNVLKLENEWSSVTLTGFSAGYGAVRAILRDRKNVARVNNVLLLDGIHASYSPEGAPPVINVRDLDSFIEFGKLAISGKKIFVITHSAIVPGAYASTTECTTFLIDTLGLRRRMSRSRTSTGMDRQTTVDAKGFHVRGYSGSTAADHVDHIHSMSEWLELLKL